MNIYFDSNFSSTSSLPPSATFQSLTANGLTIPPAMQGDVLTIDSNKKVTGIQIGPANYVMQSDGTYPQWTNNLNVNQITSASYKIPGTTHGDLFTVDGSNFLQRIGIGASGNILSSDGTQFSWQPIDLPNPLQIQNLKLTNGTLNLINSNINLDASSSLNTVRVSGMNAGNIFCRSGVLVSESNQNYFQVGAVNNITTSTTTFFTNTFKLINGADYKISLSANLIASTSTSFNLAIGGANKISQTLPSTTNFTRIIIYTAASTGAVTFSLSGLTSTGTASILNYHLLCEPFN